MNERIRELKQQAIDYVDSVDDGFGIEHYRELVDQKFAELIVKECSEQVMSIGRYNTPSGITPDLAIAISVGLKKHFGVEE